MKLISIFSETDMTANGFGMTAINSMRDQTRMAMCIFMFAVLAFNPFGALLSPGTRNIDLGAASGTGRTLQGLPDEGIYYCVSEFLHCYLFIIQG